MTGPAELVLGDLVVRLEPPVDPVHDLLPTDWAQEAVYGQPLWGRTFVDATSRISIWTKRAGLMLVDGHDVPALPHLLRFLGAGDQRDYGVRMSESTDPLREGYFTALSFGGSRDGPQAHALAEVVAGFVAAEVKRLDLRVEGVLRHHYRSVDPQLLIDDDVYRYTDLPDFDSGHMGFGFGLMADSGRISRLWSRPVHHHK
jgi:hypothetical protein